MMTRVAAVALGAVVSLAASAHDADAYAVRVRPPRVQAATIRVSPAPGAHVPPDPTLYLSTTLGTPPVIVVGDVGVVPSSIEALGQPADGTATVYALHMHAVPGHVKLIFLDGFHLPVEFVVAPQPLLASRGEIRISTVSNAYGIERVDVDGCPAAVIRLERAFDREMLVRGDAHVDVALQGARTIPTLAVAESDPFARPDGTDAPYHEYVIPEAPRLALRVTAYFIDGSTTVTDADAQASRVTTVRPSSPPPAHHCPHRCDGSRSGGLLVGFGALAAGVVGGFVLARTRRRRRVDAIVP
jgi:hypothetical protein